MAFRTGNLNTSSAGCCSQRSYRSPRRSARVYKFGLLPPTENADIVNDQMRLAHRYRNDLTAIERARRAAERSLLEEFGCRDAFAERLAAAEELREARRAVGETRQEIHGGKPKKARKSMVVGAPILSRVDAAKERLNKAWDTT